MSEPKTLNLKRIFVLSIHDNLKNTPPKDFPTTEEIKNTISHILPSLKEHIEEYGKLQEEAKELQLKLASKELSEEEVKHKVEDINARWKKYTSESGQDVCAVSLTPEAFTTLKSQYDRKDWGTKWTANLDEFAEVSEAFTEASK